MNSDVADLLASLRAEAAVPETILIAVIGHAPAAIYPNEITGKTDDELLALIGARLAEHNPKARE